jgi:glucosamine 6-phosphate synthetase-like amidotransferase/phosphosugar isomerase protein
LPLVSYIQAEGFAAGELKHGTIALIEEGTPVIGIVTDAKVAAHTRGNLKECRKFLSTSRPLPWTHNSRLLARYRRHFEYTSDNLPPRLSFVVFHQSRLLLHAGPEIAVASTKAYTAQIAVLAILAWSCV